MVHCLGSVESPSETQVCWLLPPARWGMQHLTCLNHGSAHQSPPSNQTSYLVPPNSKSARAWEVPERCTPQGTSQFRYLLHPGSLVSDSAHLGGARGLAFSASK